MWTISVDCRVRLCIESGPTVALVTARGPQHKCHRWWYPYHHSYRCTFCCLQSEVHVACFHFISFFVSTIASDCQSPHNLCDVQSAYVSLCGSLFWFESHKGFITRSVVEIVRGENSKRHLPNLIPASQSHTHVQVVTTQSNNVKTEGISLYKPDVQRKHLGIFDVVCVSPCRLTERREKESKQ